MELLATLGFLLGSTWAAGVNLYLTAACLGLAHRFGWIVLPGDLEVLSDPLIILLAVLIYAIEFIADKVPYVDSAWDSVHTFVRPAGGAMLAYMAMPEADPIVKTAFAMVGGAIALDSHLVKSGTRVAINASPEPVTNIMASVTEDVSVIGAIWLIIQYPIIISTLVILFIIFSIWVIPKLFGLIKKGFQKIFGKNKVDS